MRIMVAIVAVGTFVLLALSFAGALHPAGDSFAVVRIPLAGFGLICALALYRFRIAQLGAVICAAILVMRVLDGQEGPFVAEPDVIVYQKNMLFRDYDEAGLVRDIRDSGAQVVMLQEVSEAHDDFLDVMKDSHPHQSVCLGTAVGGVVVLSRDRIVASRCSDPAGIVVVDVAWPDGKTVVRVVSLHLHWPWPLRQAEVLDQMLPDFETLVFLEGVEPDYTVLGGDFNMVPWGHSLRRVAAVFGVERVGHVERTFELFRYPMTIDHVMASPHAQASIEVRPRLGSDHFGVVGRIQFNAP